MGKRKNLNQSVDKKNIRRNSLLTSYGVGAIVPLPDDESLMVAGLDMWDDAQDDQNRVYDDRLAARLGVKYLYRPPEKIPAVRFPGNYYCPTCNRVYESHSRYISKPDMPKCEECGAILKPERFVVICENGHIGDFPIGQWVHNGKYPSSDCKMKRYSEKARGYASDVWYKCSCGASANMATAMGKGALARRGCYCHGRRPWFKDGHDEQCNCESNQVMVTLKGSHNVWYPIIRSSIVIPFERPSTLIIEEIAEKIADYKEMGFSINHKKLAEKYNFSIEDIIKIENNEPISVCKIDDDEDAYRLNEYKQLLKSIGGANDDFHCINNQIALYDKRLWQYFKSISLIKRLKETRAFVGFSRLIPRDDMSIYDAKKTISLQTLDWLPAIQVFGEGIFIEFDKDFIEKWKQQNFVKNRCNILDKAFHKVKMWDKYTEHLNAEFILIHTFAHLIINQLSYECGYGSSSLRERIYCKKVGDDNTMFGVLIYTASSDSEGSMGGLVKQGKPGYLENIIFNAVDNSRWCSSDPVCIDSMGQGQDSCNLAACHNCALLPETSCENANRLLDRVMLIDPECGYFKDLVL